MGVVRIRGRALPGGDVVDLFAVAAAQAARTGWAKVIADWYPEDEPVPVGVLAAVVEAGLPGTSRSSGVAPGNGSSRLWTGA